MRYFDLHCDTISECYLQKQPLYCNNLHLSLLQGKEFEAWTQCFAVWIPDQLRGKEAMCYFKNVFQTFLKECDLNKETMMRCLEQQDLEKVQQTGKCGAVLTIEGGAVLAGDLADIEQLATCGVHMLTLTWNGACEIGDGAMVEQPKGLTAFGRSVIPELEKHKIVVDVSHASAPLFYDVAELAKKPFVASHSNAKAVCDHPRNLTDEQFTMIKQSGGLVGLNFHPPFLEKDGLATVDDIVRHAEHFLSLGGENTLAIGSDFDGADLPGGITGISGIGAIFERFLRLGYSQSLLDQIFYENANKFFVSL